MCQISLSPDSCVGTTRRIYEKVGPRSLILAKYIPGFAAVSTTLAGQAGTTWRQFLLYDGIGAVQGASGAVALGTVFHEFVDALLTTLDDLGAPGNRNTDPRDCAIHRLQSGGSATGSCERSE